MTEKSIKESPAADATPAPEDAVCLTTHSLNGESGVIQKADAQDQQTGAISTQLQPAIAAENPTLE